jgi:PAS domain S-box-containing protein
MMKPHSAERRTNDSQAARQAMRDSEERFAGAFEHAPIGVALISPDGHWLRVNRALCNLVGYTEAELLTRTFQDITYPEDLDLDMDNLRRMLGAEIRSCQMEKRYVHKLGHLVAVMLNVSLVRDEQGAPRYFIAHIQDISERKRAHAALLEREAELKETQRLAGLGSWYLDLGTGDVRWSEQSFRMFGLDPARGAPSFAGLAALLDAASFATLDAALHETMERGTEFVIEVETVRPDRSRRWLVLRGAPVRDAAGAICAVRGTAFDTTARKRASEALRASEAEFRTLAESMPQIVWVTDSDGRVLYFNQKWMDYTGLSLEQSVGDDWTLPFHPDDRQRSWDAWHLAIATEGIYSLECRLRRADGAYRWWLTRGVPQRDASGQILKWFGTCTDIHDMKLAQESLRLLDSAVQQASESVMITDADLAAPGPRIVFVNPAFTRMTGYTREEVVGQTPRLLQGPKTDRAVLSRLRRELERGDTFEGETINYRKDGSEFALEWQIAPVRDAAGEVTHYVAVQRDVTERRRALAELAATHQQLVTSSRLAGMAEVATNVLHNVGNVLNSVNVSAGMLVATVGKSRAANLGKVVRLLREHEQDLGLYLTSDIKGRRLPAYLGQLADHLLEEQKATVQELDCLLKNIEHIKSIVAVQQEHARGTGIRELVDLRHLLEDGLSLDTAPAALQAVQVIREFDDVPPVNIDKHKVLQILVNLIGNARQACEDSGRAVSDPVDKRITLGLARDADRVRISVTDNGVGIAPGNLVRIFNHGFTTREEGHGFGLHGGALAAREMGGSLTVHSDGPGRGATFTLELPVDTGQARP